jgi:cation diffusion facilitator family transporter
LKSKAFIYVALGADIAIAIIKFLAAAVTRSSSMVSEGIHSVIDTGNQVLLLIGIKSSQKKPDEDRPFGYGKELYFWSFIVSLLIFTLGGCVALYEGVSRLRNPVPLKDQTWNYIVLAAAFLFNGISGISTLKKFNKDRGDLPFWTAIRESKDPSVFTVLLSDIGDGIGLLIAFAAIFIGNLTGNYYYDGIGSLLIGAVLIGISTILLFESKSLLMGESISKRNIHKIISITESDPSVQKVKKHFSMYMAPEEVVLQLVASFNQDLTTHEITDAIQRIITNIQKRFPRIKQIFIEPV